MTNQKTPVQGRATEERVRAVRTGAPEVQLLACVECGVLLWDIDAHYRDAHPEAKCDHPNQINAAVAAVLDADKMILEGGDPRRDAENVVRIVFDVLATYDRYGAEEGR